MKVVDYKILDHYSEHNLVDLVQKYITSGWQPIGGMASASDWFYQAMVKYEESTMETK